MADKLNDDEIAEELKRFGETIKLPIDKKRRPILVKKLNHHYAKENPPPKRARSGGRQSKPRPAPVAEFSDESQDESETDNNLIRVSYRKNQSLNNTSRNESPVRNTRNVLNTRKTMENGAGTNRTQSRDRSSGGKRGQYAAGPTRSQMEVYPDEFSDNDTADESIYEVEEQSVGVNTSMNFDDTFDDEELNPSFSAPVKRKIAGKNRSKRVSSSPATPKSYVTRANKRGDNKDELQDSTEHFISKSILMIMAIFFMVLGLSYVYIRRDIFLTNEAAITQESDLKTIQVGEEELNYTKENVTKALGAVRDLLKELANRKGKFELGDVTEKDKGMSRDEVTRRVTKMSEEPEDMVTLCFHLILKHPEWDILAFHSDGTDATEIEDMSYIESRYGDLAMPTRVYLAFLKVLYGLGLLIFCFGVCFLGIFFLRWQNKKKEVEQLKVYEMVEKIIEILKENSELSERKNDAETYPPYLAVQHVRDQLIPISKRKPLNQLWMEAVKFIESNESRIRVDTQIIHGEEFNVWRWLPAVPNGHKVWQGQAFGETSQSNVNVLPYGPTPCLKVRNMFDANAEPSSDDWHLDIEEGILEKCKDVSGILHIFVDRNSREGCVYIKCDSCQKAFETYQALHGWWFDGRLVTVKYLRLEHYHDRFPDSRNRKYPLKPTSDQMSSVSRPYHRSALEMT